jgi:hypothetical protein
MAAGVIPLSLVDGDGTVRSGQAGRLEGDYTLYLRVERLLP